MYYTVIDHERIKIAFDMVKNDIQIPKVIQIVGTNGKGSTGRMMAHLISKTGMNVGHYTSPHILSFNERFWLNGVNCGDDLLEIAHQKLYSTLPVEISGGLSYFEYTTLLALFVFEECDYIILEAGMGGEFDATSVVPKIASVITPIDMDHQAFLGNDISSIATTKLKSIDRLAIIAPQVHDEVMNIAKNIAKDARLVFVKDFNRKSEIIDIAIDKKWGSFLIDNAMVACVALDMMEIQYSISDLSSWTMNGRYFAYSQNIRIDVGHNVLAARAIYDTLKAPVILIYNSLEDKPYRKILELLKQKIVEVQIINIDTPRALQRDELISTLDGLGIKHKNFTGEIDKNKNYLVFGSFSVAEAFLKEDIVYEK